MLHLAALVLCRKLEHELKEKNPELHSRCYFFNTFFFKKLTEVCKGHMTCCVLARCPDLL